VRKPRRLLAIVDLDAEAHPGLEKAGRLAAALDARLEAYACEWSAVAPRRGRGANRARTEALDAREAALAALVRAVVPPEVRTTVAVDFEHPRDAAILAYVRDAAPDLVLLDSHFHPGVRRALFGPADWPLIRRCPVPLLYAKPRPGGAAPRVAVAVDPGHPADPDGSLDAALVAAGVALAGALRGSLCLVHAFLPLAPVFALPAIAGAPGLDPSAAQRAAVAAEQAARERVGALLPRRVHVRPEVVLLHGAAVETLPGFAEVEQLDVLALGAVARRGARGRLYEAVIGATAERLLERVDCDLLVVPTPRDRAQRRVRRRVR